MKVIPVSLRVKPPLKTKQAFEIANKAGRAFLNERIKETQKKREEITSTIRVTQHKDDFERLCRICKEAAERNILRSWKDLSGRRDPKTLKELTDV